MWLDYLLYPFRRWREGVEELRRRDADERRRAEARAAKLVALRNDPATMCPECAGFGETRVRGVRTITGYEVCAYCGGLGCDVNDYEKAMNE